MALDYASFRTLAERLIEANGRTISLVRRDQGNPVDSAKPWRDSTEADTVTFELKGVIIDFEKEDFVGSLVRRGDKRILIADKSVAEEGPAFKLLFEDGGGVLLLESGDGSALVLEADTLAAANITIEDYDHILDGAVRWKIIGADTIAPGDTLIMYDIHVRQ